MKKTTLYFCSITKDNNSLYTMDDESFETTDRKKALEWAESMKDIYRDYERTVICVDVTASDAEFDETEKESPDYEDIISGTEETIFSWTNND